MQYLLSFLILLLTAGITIGKEFFVVFGINTNFLLLALIAIVIAGVMAHQRLLLVALISGLSLMTNMPAEFLLQYGLDKEILLKLKRIHPFLRLF